MSTDKFGQKHCVVVVKATFDIDKYGDCQPAAEQAAFVYADQHHGDAGLTSILYESDFAPLKPQIDILVNANAIAPGGRPVTELEIALMGPGFIKRAKVTGDRMWDSTLSGIRPSDPQPFSSMPIIWERAFGGSDLSQKRANKNGSEMRNLVGVGFHLNSDEKTIVGTPLPNIEKLDTLMRSWSDKTEPLGFGPLGRGWQPRISFAGTYDQQWMDETLPFLPIDFDNRYYQSAPLDQQLPILKAKETFYCLNMSTDGRFVANLPFFEVPVRFLFDDQTESLNAAPDTLILEPQAERMILIGRVGVPLPRKFTTLREVQVGKLKRTQSFRKSCCKETAESITA